MIHLKAFEQFKDPHYLWLLDSANDVIQQWAGRSPKNPLRSRLASMSSLFHTAAHEIGLSHIGIPPAQDFFPAESTTSDVGDSYTQPFYSGEAGFGDFGFGS